MSPTSPQLLNQAPPRAQQVRLPDVPLIPHLAHPPLVFAAAGCIVNGSVGECGGWHDAINANINAIASHRFRFMVRIAFGNLIKASRCMTRYPSECQLVANPGRLQLTVTSLNALDPGMIKLRVASISALLEPGSAASTTTSFAGFFCNCTLWA